MRWIGELGDADLDPQLLLWDMHRNIDHTAVPEGQTVVRFHFPDAAPRARDWWLLIKPDDVDVCDDDPGQPVTVTITADLRTMVRIWRGDLSWSPALGAEQVRIEGPLRRAVPSWFALSPFAAVPRPQPKG